MATTKSLLCAAALLVCGVIANFQRADAQGCGQFQSSCPSYVVAETDTESGYVIGLCNAEDGEDNFSIIDLNDHLGNNNGVLVAEKGGTFSASCNTLSFTVDQKTGHVVLNAKCKNKAGQYGDASYDISQYMANDNGLLHWRDQC